MLCAVPHPRAALAARAEGHVRKSDVERSRKAQNSLLCPLQGAERVGYAAERGGAGW
jgi:hypothetical protein